MGLRQWGGMGALPGVRTHVGDRALEPGAWGGSTRAPKKRRHKVSRADGSSRVELGRSPHRHCIGWSRRAVWRMTYTGAHRHRHEAAAVCTHTGTSCCYIHSCVHTVAVVHTHMHTVASTAKNLVPSQVLHAGQFRSWFTVSPWAWVEGNLRRGCVQTHMGTHKCR